MSAALLGGLDTARFLPAQPGAGMIPFYGGKAVTFVRYRCSRCDVYETIPSPETKPMCWMCGQSDMVGPR